jgi:tetratricopeptide (TPR) repeat protein
VGPAARQRALEELCPPAQIAAARKTLGNAAYGKKDFETACELYTKAIEVTCGAGLPLPLTYLMNRAQCHVARMNMGAALRDARQALGILQDPLAP